jgi:hypothetical protein
LLNTHPLLPMKTAIDQNEQVAVLNRLFHILSRSLPAYLQDAKPWTAEQQHKAQQAVGHLAIDQQDYARRVAEAILKREGCPEPGRFPIAFTGINDVAIDFLLQRVIEHHRDDLTAIQRCAATVSANEELRVLTEEILGNGRGHLEILQKMAKAE